MVKEREWEKGRVQRLSQIQQSKNLKQKVGFALGVVRMRRKIKDDAKVVACGITKTVLD